MVIAKESLDGDLPLEIKVRVCGVQVLEEIELTAHCVLHFGIAMNPRFAVNDGLNYPGEFKVDVKILKK